MASRTFLVATLYFPVALLLAYAGYSPPFVSGEPVPEPGHHQPEDAVHHAMQLKSEWLEIVRRSRGLVKQCSSETLDRKVNKVWNELHEGQLLLGQIRQNGAELKKISSHLRGADKALRHAEALIMMEFVIELMPILNIMHLVSSTFALAAHIQLCRRALPPRVLASRLCPSHQIGEFVSLNEYSSHHICSYENSRNTDTFSLHVLTALPVPWISLPALKSRACLLTLFCDMSPNQLSRTELRYAGQRQHHLLHQHQTLCEHQAYRLQANARGRTCWRTKMPSGVSFRAICRAFPQFI